MRNSIDSEKFGFVSVCNIDRTLEKSQHEDTRLWYPPWKRMHARWWVQDRWKVRERRWEIPEASTNRRILATPREPLNDISEIARGNIRPVDFSLLGVAEGNNVARYNMGWVRKIGARGDIPLTLIASKRLFTFFFPRTNRMDSSTMELFTARKLSIFLLLFLGADNGRSFQGRCFTNITDSRYCFHLAKQTISIFVSRSFFSLRFFEETIWRKSVLCDRKRKGKVEKSWCSKNVNRVDPKEWWNVAITRWDYVNESVSRAKRPYANSNSGAIHYGHVIRKKMVLTVYTDFSLIYTSFEKISSNIIN